MTPRIRRRLRALLALAGLAPPTASGQSLARFVPVELDGKHLLELRFVRETTRSTELQPWPAREIGWPFVRVEGRQQDLDALTPVAKDPTLLRVEREDGLLPERGVLLAGWDLPPQVESVHPVDLRAFLGERWTKDMPREFEALPLNKSVSLLRLESLALVAREVATGATAAEPAAMATSKSGQRMELRALLDPTLQRAGSEFTFKLSLPDGGAENVVCLAVHLTTRKTQALERHADGSMRVKLEQSGPWMLEATRLRALDGTAGAALELASSTLVFIVPATVPDTKAPAPEKGGGK